MKAEYVSHMGDDLTIVNAARVSFDKESKILNQKDRGLIKYLAKHKHWTPFAHAIVTIRMTVPIFLANQLKRHQVGFALNEVSRRYVDTPPEFYMPPAWRGRPENSIKQGSNPEVEISEPKIYPFLPGIGGDAIRLDYDAVLKICNLYYETLIASGVAPEMARMVLPQSMYTSWWWTGSIAAWARMCQQRLDSHAQVEAQMIAKQVFDIIQPLFPASFPVLLDTNLMDPEEWTRIGVANGWVTATHA